MLINKGKTIDDVSGQRLLLTAKFSLNCGPDHLNYLPGRYEPGYATNMYEGCIKK